MKMIVLPRTEYQITTNAKTYTATYFGNVLAQNADTETLTEYNPATTYNYLDEIKIASLNTKYTAVVNSPKGHPQNSSGWFQEGINEYRFRDSLFTSQSVFSDTEAIIDFSITAMSHIVGQNLSNVKTVEFYKINENDSDGALISSISLFYLESYDCDSCCNPEPYLMTSFYCDITASSCINGESKIRVKMIKNDPAKPILIGSLVVGVARDLGCSLSGMTLELKIPKNTTEFPELRATGVRPANVETYIRGNTIISVKKVDEIRTMVARHGAYLNFYLFDEHDEVRSGIVLGRFLKLSAPITHSSHTSLPIEIFGIQN